jgi:hypothetical protein
MPARAPRGWVVRLLRRLRGQLDATRNRVVRGEALLDAAREFAREIVRNSAFGLRLTKQGLQINVDAPSIHAAIEISR